MYNAVIDDLAAALAAGAGAGFLVLSTTDAALPQLFDGRSKFAQAVFMALEEHGSVELKASYFLDGEAGDALAFEPGQSASPAEYRAVDDAGQLAAALEAVCANLAALEDDRELRAALEVATVALSFRVAAQELHFVFAPVFTRHFKAGEAYAGWVQLKAALKSGDAGSPARLSAAAAFAKYQLAARRLRLLLFVESQPDKAAASLLLLEEAQRLLADLQSRPASRSASSRDSALAAFGVQVAREAQEFASQAFARLDGGLASAADLRSQLALLAQKVELAAESAAGPARQALAQSQQQLELLGDALASLDAQAERRASREQAARREPSQLGSTRKPSRPAQALPPRAGQATQKAARKFRAALDEDNVHTSQRARHRGEKERRHSRRRERSDSSDSQASSSGDSRRGSRSRSILGRLKGDLAECDHLQLIKLAHVAKERDGLEATNREFAGLVKDLKRQADDAKAQTAELAAQARLHDAELRRALAAGDAQTATAKEQAATIAALNAKVAAEQALLAEKKLKWKARIAEHAAEAERLKASLASLEHRAASFEQLAAEQEQTLAEEREKIAAVEARLAALHGQLEDARREVAANQEKTQAQETELAELAVRLQYETKASADLRGEVAQLKAQAQEKDKAMEDLRKEQRKKKDKLAAAKDLEIAKLAAENAELKALLAKADGRGSELEAALTDLKERFDDSVRQLNVAEVRLTELVREKELVVELKAAVGEREQDIAYKRDFIGVGVADQKLEKEVLLGQSRQDASQAEVERLQDTIAELRSRLAQKDSEVCHVLEEKDDLLRKASELEGKVIELDHIQRHDIEGLENRVEHTILELRAAKEDNSNLLLALSKAEAAFTEADSKYVTFRDKYYSKKTEANVLRDKLDKLVAELSRLKLEHSKATEALDHRRIQLSACENKSKVTDSH